MTKSRCHECDLADLKAALFYSGISESEFMQRAMQDFDLDWHQALEIIVQSRTAEAGNA